MSVISRIIAPGIYYYEQTSDQQLYENIAGYSSQDDRYLNTYIERNMTLREEEEEGEIKKIYIYCGVLLLKTLLLLNIFSQFIVTQQPPG